MKKITAFLLVLCLFCAGLLPASAAAGKAKLNDISGHWAEDSILWAFEKGILRGTSETKFSPEGAFSRAMAVTVLFRISEETAPSAEKPFTDVSSGTYYYDAVIWGKENEIVSGTSATLFSPAKSITREDFVTMLYRYARYKNADMDTSGDLSGFTDKDSVSGYARDALAWAAGNGIVQGSGGKIQPKRLLKRCEAAAILKRFVGDTNWLFSINVNFVDKIQLKKGSDSAADISDRAQINEIIQKLNRFAYVEKTASSQSAGNYYSMTILYHTNPGPRDVFLLDGASVKHGGYLYRSPIKEYFAKEWLDSFFQ